MFRSQPNAYGGKQRCQQLHILHLGIKYGRRVPDPQGVKGAFVYTTKMLRNGKEYLLEVVVREADWTSPLPLQMNHPPPQVVTTPRLESCRARTVWDGESAVLHAGFDSAPPAGPPTSQTLAEHLDESLRIRTTPPRLVVGNVEIAFRDEWHIETIAFRTNPSAWKKESIPDVSSLAVPASIAFQVEYDDNGIFTMEMPVVVRWDAVANRLAVSFGDRGADKWYRIADSVAVGTSADGSLAELHFSAVEIVGRVGSG